MTTHVLYYMEERRNKNVFELSRVIRCSYKRLNTVFVVRAWFVLLLYIFFVCCCCCCCFFLSFSPSCCVCLFYIILFLLCPFFTLCPFNVSLHVHAIYFFIDIKDVSGQDTSFECSISLALYLSVCIGLISTHLWLVAADSPHANRALRLRETFYSTTLKREKKKRNIQSNNKSDIRITTTQVCAK